MNTNSDSSKGGVTPGPLITVVMPCYNHANFVSQAVKSVLGQTYQNVQLVVIDDGSVDDSVEVLVRLSKEYSFDLICQENRGVCRTLNRGVREVAKGEFIALLASDDYWHREKLELQLEALRRDPESEFCFSKAIVFSDNVGEVGGLVFPRRCQKGKVVDRVFVRQHVPAGTMMFSRSLYDRLGGFDEDLKEEDWDFVIRSAHITRFTAVDRPLLYYRSHAGNTMKTRSRRAIFHQKARILAKNFNLVSPWRWLYANLLHFAHDIILSRFLKG